MRRLSSERAAGVLLRSVVALLFLLPLFWMVATALTPPGTPLPTSLRLLPERPTLENFGRIWEVVPLGRFTLNSLKVVALGVPLTVVTASWAGLGMARLPRPAQRRWVVISLAVLMVPGIALWSTRFLIFRALGWYDSVWALVAPAWMGTSPFYVLIFYRAFRRIPGAIYDTARLDGAGVLQLWARIALPMARPSVVGVGILAFIFYWGDFTSPLLYLNDQSHYTLPVALQLLEQLTRADWALLMAAAAWATLFPVLLFVLVQPYFAGRAEG
ncbi:MAG: carbohydrate ABC transporter permease [Candidatus Promineifilaceae bacterium]|nr:carbohydrate ABC transporter permease [Candidatus Promineifilaceae bacterium]